MWRAFILSVFLSTSTSQACIWDYDTLRDEHRERPGVVELLAGAIEKRSTFFYEDRVQRMNALLKTDPDNKEAIDNLAVALFRVGKSDEAIQTLLDKEKRFPDQYTTASNLATLYMLRDQSEQAVPLLEKALKINPDAHFGREKYQLELARFLVNAKSKTDYPLSDFLGTQLLVEQPDKSIGAVSFHLKANPLPTDYVKKIDAILGMIRFGTDQSPDLYFALGNLFNQLGDRHLAVRAYGRAIDLKHPHAEYIKKLVKSMRSLMGDQISTKEGQNQKNSSDEKIATERTAGAKWQKAYMDFGDNLIRQGKDPDLETNYKTFYDRFGRAN